MPWNILIDLKYKFRARIFPDLSQQQFLVHYLSLQEKLTLLAYLLVWYSKCFDIFSNNYSCFFTTSDDYCILVKFMEINLSLFSGLFARWLENCRWYVALQEINPFTFWSGLGLGLGLRSRAIFQGQFS